MEGEGTAPVWNDFAAAYSQHLSPWTLPASLSIATAAQLSTCQSVIEVGCGPGNHIGHVRAMMPPIAKYMATDASDKMLDFAIAQRHEHVSFKVAKAESLPFEDGTFDRYISNLVLNHTQNPQAALAEAYRVLKPGSIAVFSIFGRQTQSPMQTIVPNVLRRMGYDKEILDIFPGMAPFVLGEDPLALRQHITELGFTRTLMWHQPLPLPVTNGKEFAQNRLVDAMPRAEQLRASLGEEKFQQLSQEVLLEAETILASGQPIALDLLIVVAVKG